MTEIDDADLEDTESADDCANTAKEHTADTAPPITVELERCEQASVIAGLAAALPVNASLLLVITKTSETELLVTVQPGATKDEPASCVRPIQVQGTIDEIDAGLVDALASFTPARQLVVATAEQIARETASAAAAAKAEAERKRTASSTRPAAPDKITAALEKLLVNVEPALATVVVKDGKGKTHPVTRGKRTALPVGTYTISASADGYQSAAPQTVDLKKGTPMKIDLVLKREEPSLLDGI